LMDDNLAKVPKPSQGFAVIYPHRHASRWERGNRKGAGDLRS
jgi:hypothetical protein